MSEKLTWRDRLKRASFRGFEFLTDNHDATEGRRLVVHEFPGADAPLVEDLGAKAQIYKVNAYFIGENYDLERNGFLVKLATPGAEWLTHPWLGYIWVRPRTWSIQERTDQGGYCAVSIEFVPGGEAPFTFEPDRVDVAYQRIRKYFDAVEADFKPKSMSAGGLTGFIAAVQAKLEVLRTILSLATLPLTWASQIMGLVASIKTEIGALMALPGQYAAAWRSLCNALGFGPDGSSLDDTARPRVVRRIIAAGATPSVPTGAAATDPAARQAIAQSDALIKRTMIGAAALVALADYRVAEDRDAVLAAVLDALDESMPAMSDEVFQEAANMRGALIDALLAQDLDPAQYRDVVSPLPATLLAHRMQVDEDVLLARNKVRHPLFVQGRVYG
jgi:hypothetical protein